MRQIGKSVSPMSNDGRNAYVIEHITDALIKLLKEKPLEKISISELCELAGIGRASFYRNFNSKEDILSTYTHQIFQEWAGETTPTENTPLSELLRSIFAHFERHRPFYKLLNQRNLIYLLKNVIIGFFNPSTEDSKEAAYSKAFVAYALYGWIEVWFQRGMKENADEIAEMFRNHGF